MEIRQALCICPETVGRAVCLAPDWETLEELRFRLGKRLQMVCSRGTRTLDIPVTQELLQSILDRATKQSAYAVQGMLRCGFVTIPGGHRLGICGTAVVQQGEITAIRDISSLSLRIAREVRGAGETCMRLLWTHPQSTLLVGPPGAGKTTLLRDTIRLLSARRRVCLVDERQEVAACLNGLPQFDLGDNTDILSAAPKAQGIELLIRAMNPQWIALDEITAAGDVQAMVRASYCGVKFLATAHAANRQELFSRPLYRVLMEEKIFRNLVFLRENHEIRTERCEGEC